MKTPFFSLADRIACSAVLLALAFFLVSAGPALSAGYGVKEWSATAMGSAYAGASATSSDASFLSYNPAAAGAVVNYDSAVSAVGILPTSSANITGATTSAGTPAGGLASPDHLIGEAIVPNLAARMRLAPEWSVGLSIYAPWGLRTDYPMGWAGRYHALQTRLLTVNISPVIAYRIANNFSIAVGPQFQYAKGTLSSAVDIGTIGALFAVPGAVPGTQDGIARFKADSWGYGFTLGAMGDIAEGVSVGVSYRSAVRHTLEGPLTFTLDGAGVGAAINGATGLFTNTKASAKLITPEQANFGTRVALAPQWTGLFEVNWTNWSRFSELRIDAVNPAQPDDVTTAQWKNAWFFALGAEYAADERWTWRGGIAWDQSPVPAATFNPRIPDADRTWVSAGFTYRANDNMSFALSYAHLFLPRGTIALNAAQTGNALRGNLSGRTEAGVDVVGVQISYRTGN